MKRANLERSERTSHRTSRHTLRRNLIVNVLGMLTRGTHLLLLLAVGRAFGSAVLGQFLLGLGGFEIATAVVITGFTDGTMLLLSRGSVVRPRNHSGLDGRELGGGGGGGEVPGDDGVAQRMRVAATALRAGGVMAIVLALAVTLLARRLPARVMGSYSELLPGVAFLAWALVPCLVTRVAFASTTAALRLEWEAIVGAAAPPVGVLLALPVVRARAGTGLRGLFVALLVTHVALAVAAAMIARRHLPLARLWTELRRPGVDRALLRFALPQALNMAATTYITRMDVLMLAALGSPAALVGVYGAVAAVVLELRQIRLAVSGALGALVARDHASGAQRAIAETLSRAATWTTSIAVPLALGFVVVRHEVVALVAPGYAGDDRFVLVLLLGPLVNCMGGLAGNFLVYMLHNRWNLANSLVVAVVNTVLCGYLIPILGLTGAAISGTLAIALVTVLENLELAALEGVHIAPGVLARAAVTLALGGVALWVIECLHTRARWSARTDLAIGVTLTGALLVRGWRGWPRRVREDPREPYRRELEVEIGSAS